MYINLQILIDHNIYKNIIYKMSAIVIHENKMCQAHDVPSSVVNCENMTQSDFDKALSFLKETGADLR